MVRHNDYKMILVADCIACFLSKIKFFLQKLQFLMVKSSGGIFFMQKTAEMQASGAVLILLMGKIITQGYAAFATTSAGQASAFPLVVA